MYISVPKNYSGNAFPHPDAARVREGGGMPRPGAPIPEFGVQPQQVQPRPPVHAPSPPSPAPPFGKIPRDLPPPPPPSPSECAPAPETCADAGDEEVACQADGCADACGTQPSCNGGGKNPLTCLFEALRGRKKGGFDADDFLLIGLIALLMGKEGSEDIVLILALLLLV